MVALLLLPATAWSSTYFWIQTAPGQSLLAAALVARFDDGLFRFEGVGWGPAPDRMWLRGVVVHDATSQPALTVETATVDLDLVSTLAGGPTVDRAVLRGFGVHLAWDEQGAFNLSRRWLRAAPEAREPPEAAPRTYLHNVSLVDGVVTLTWPTWGMGFEAVSTHGDLGVGGPDGLTISAELQGSGAVLSVGDRSLRFDDHGIERFVWKDRGFHADGVSLTSATGAVATASGDMRFSRGLSLDATGSASLPASGDGGLVNRWLPEGGSVERWSLGRRAGGPWAFDVVSVRTPVLRVAGLNVSGLQASIEGDYGAGALLPQGTVRSRGATAEVVTIGDKVVASSLTVGSLDVDMGTSMEATVEAVDLGALTMEDQTVRDLRLGGAIVANVGGGSVQGALGTADGGVKVSGPIDLSPLRGRADVALTFGFEGVRSGLAAWVRRGLPDE
ncbi:MAG: hypothetical protein QF464_10630, partial [Myxococcota bacterium]|nr:hypothetical protein [Myxococcota bacterium]